MKYRKLRIAWSVGWGVVCVLLIALWVLSYHLAFPFAVPFRGNDWLAITSREGTIAVGVGPRSALYWERTRIGEQPPSQFVFTPTGGSRDVEWEAEFFGFGVTLYPTDSHIFMPIWFVVLSTAALAPIPWLHWSNRFSLRTLLIATTLLAVALGVIVYTMR
jgi:hypothetical protein